MFACYKLPIVLLKFFLNSLTKFDCKNKSANCHSELVSESYRVWLKKIKLPTVKKYPTMPRQELLKLMLKEHSKNQQIRIERIKKRNKNNLDNEYM